MCYSLHVLLFIVVHERSHCYFVSVTLLPDACAVIASHTMTVLCFLFI